MSVEYDLDVRAPPEAYRYRRGEQGVFKSQPHKDELLPHWGFKDEETAREAVSAIQDKYEDYRAEANFVGMDMARKFLQMSFRWAMRYAKYPSAQKYDDGTERSPRQWADPQKRAAAIIFRDAWQAVTDDPVCQHLKEAHQEDVYAPAVSPMVEA